jgi:hypothetical protein
MNRLALTISAALLLGGCANSITPNYDKRFGEAVRSSRSQMVLNPTPATGPLVGMDGPAAREAQVRYQNTFKDPPPVVNVINIGGGISGSK